MDDIDEKMMRMLNESVEYHKTGRKRYGVAGFIILPLIILSLIFFYYKI
ncbi:MAG: hypothetical protein HN737_08510 [Desulfobacterales bacterium]|jgi:hypothetical protein|nr:hypothetical protein [Desulfobacteraceae bacterium]MBT7697438.1 hypothetical protein [Desulfobacterales bacterium]